MGCCVVPGLPTGVIKSIITPWNEERRRPRLDARGARLYHGTIDILMDQVEPCWNTALHSSISLPEGRSITVRGGGAFAVARTTPPPPRIKECLPGGGDGAGDQEHPEK